MSVGCGKKETLPPEAWAFNMSWREAKADTTIHRSGTAILVDFVKVDGTTESIIGRISEEGRVAIMLQGESVLGKPSEVMLSGTLAADGNSMSGKASSPQHITWSKTWSATKKTQNTNLNLTKDGAPSSEG